MIKNVLHDRICVYRKKTVNVLSETSGCGHIGQYWSHFGSCGAFCLHALVS